MHALKLTIKLISPLIISARSGDSTLTQCLSYIPGTTVLGMAAGRYLKSQGANRQEFVNLFLRGALIFHNLYPYVDGKLMLPCPRNILREKENPTRFVNRFTLESLKPGYQGLEPFACVSDEYIELFDPPKEIFFHHQRDYKMGISKEGKVFNYEALSPGQSFRGSILGQKADLELIKAQLEADPCLRMGKSRSSQYGECELMHCEIAEQEIKPQSTAEGYIMLLLSDTIIKNSFGSNTPDVKSMAECLGVEILDACMDLCRIETVVTALKAKKPSEIAFKAGSVFHLKKLPNDFQELSLVGIGERCQEGFGQVCFCENHPSQLRLIKTPKKKSSKPEGRVPSVIKSLAQNSYEQMIKSYLSQQAMLQISNLKCDSMSKSLVGRLESFVASGDFSSNYTQLRDVALNKLDKAHFEGGKSFKHYLKEIDNELEKLVSNAHQLHIGKSKKLTDMAAEMELSKRDKEYWKSVYLTVLFTNLRRRLKQTGGES